MENQLSITITAPDLSTLTEKVIELAERLSRLTPAVQQPQPTAPAQGVIPGNTPAQVPYGVPTAGQPAIPAQQSTTAAGAVPTTAPEYTVGQLQTAAAPLMDAGRQNELLALLAKFGVKAVTELPKEQYGAFAMGLREMGAKL